MPEATAILRATNMPEDDRDAKGDRDSGSEHAGGDRDSSGNEHAGDDRDAKGDRDSGSEHAGGDRDAEGSSHDVDGIEHGDEISGHDSGDMRIDAMVKSTATVGTRCRGRPRCRRLLA